MASRDIRVFIARMLRSPRDVGALVPSGPALARAMASQVQTGRAGVVVELGAGTGAVTRALLAQGLPPGRLVVIEREAAFCRLLRARFPGLTVLHDDARRLQHALADYGLEQINSVVSSLPFLSLPFTTQREILRQSVQMLAPGGAFIQFTYGPASPVHPVLQRRLGLSGRPVARVWRNLPPALVWRYTAMRVALRPDSRLAA